MKKSTVLHIGLDDTDSRKGMCTTFLAYKIVEYLRNEQTKFLDYPRLIRFNPNIPWKTRGNGAVALKIETKYPRLIKRNIIRFVKKYSATKDGANPGLVFFESKDIPEDFSKFAKVALSHLVRRNEVKKFINNNGIETFHLGNGQGLIGAIGAIGYRFRDHTFELIKYRNNMNLGKKREIFKDSVKRMQQMTFLKTFNSFDETNDRILIAPHGQDPVFFGIRGENVRAVIKGASIIRSREQSCGYMIFRTNQGTSDHLQNELDIRNLKPFSSGYVSGRISTKPQIEVGGHVFFSITNDGIDISCAVYKPTGITKIASKLLEGDSVRIGGGIRKASKNHKRILNIEFLEVLDLKKHVINLNPYCNTCKKRMKSKGRNQGYQCTKCGKISLNKIQQEIPRQINKTFYLPISSSHRHLTRPIQRMDRFNDKLRFDDSARWFSKRN